MTPAAFKEIDRLTFGNPKLPPNRLFLADGLRVLGSLPDCSVDLIYADPPFFTGQKLGRKLKKNVEGPSFADQWKGDVGRYIAWISERLAEMRRVLADSGSIFVHLDWHAVHYVKMEMDKIFGYDNFLNEIIWAHGGGGAPKGRFGRKHDNILWYSKTGSFRFNPDTVRVPYATPKIRPQVYHPEKNKKSLTGVYVYTPNPKGKIATDVWSDVKALYGPSAEITGYPTQKPLALLHRLVGAASAEGSLIGDFFCGSGTTLLAAQHLGRRWLGCDVSADAVRIAFKRLKKEADARRKTQLSLFDREKNRFPSWPDAVMLQAEE